MGRPRAASSPPSSGPTTPPSTSTVSAACAINAVMLACQLRCSRTCSLLNFNFRASLPCSALLHLPLTRPFIRLFECAGFYGELAGRGHVIYPGKLTRDNCFRIGSIGRLYPADVEALLAAIKDVLAGMGVRLPVRQLQPSPA